MSGADAQQSETSIQAASNNWLEHASDADFALAIMKAAERDRKYLLNVNYHAKQLGMTDAAFKRRLQRFGESVPGKAPNPLSAFRPTMDQKKERAWTIIEPPKPKEPPTPRAKKADKPQGVTKPKKQTKKGKKDAEKAMERINAQVDDEDNE